MRVSDIRRAASGDLVWSAAAEVFSPAGLAGLPMAVVTRFHAPRAGR